MFIQSNDKNRPTYHFSPVTIKIKLKLLIINKKTKQIVETDQFQFIDLLNLFEPIIFVVQIEVRLTLSIIKVEYSNPICWDN